MKFKIDENLPIEIAEELRREGHDAATVLEENMRGFSDTKIVAVCHSEMRILITLDLDFADIRRYPPSDSPGIIVLRIEPQHKKHLVHSLRRIIPVLSKEPLSRRLWIVEEDRIRVREIAIH